LIEENEKQRLEEFKEKTMKNVEKYSQKGHNFLNIPQTFMQKNDSISKSGNESNVINLTTTASMSSNNIYDSNNLGIRIQNKRDLSLKLSHNHTNASNDDSNSMGESGASPFI
jgi:hypothetical protein